MSNVTVREIALAAAEEFGVTLEAMRQRFAVRGRAPKRPPALIARYAVVWLARRHTGVTQPELAEFFGLASRKMVERALDWAEEAIARDRELAARIERIEAAIDRLYESRMAMMERRAA